MISLPIINQLDTWSRDSNTKVTLSYCLFGAVKLTKNDDFDKYGLVVMVLDLILVHNFIC